MQFPLSQLHFLAMKNGLRISTRTVVTVAVCHKKLADAVPEMSWPPSTPWSTVLSKSYVKRRSGMQSWRKMMTFRNVNIGQIDSWTSLSVDMTLLIVYLCQFWVFSLWFSQVLCWVAQVCHVSALTVLHKCVDSEVTLRCVWVCWLVELYRSFFCDIISLCTFLVVLSI